AGRSTRAATSRTPHGQGRRGARLPIFNVGRIVIIAPRANSLPATLGPSSTTSTGAPSLTGKRRGLCARPLPIRGAAVPWTLLGAVIATTSYAVVVPVPATA